MPTMVTFDALPTDVVANPMRKYCPAEFLVTVELAMVIPVRPGTTVKKPSVKVLRVDEEKSPNPVVSVFVTRKFCAVSVVFDALTPYDPVPIASIVVDALALPMIFKDAFVNPIAVLVAARTLTWRLVLAVKATPSKSVA